MENTGPVLIVGAGPAGLYLALALLKNGINVRIIEQAKAFHVGSRGTGVHARTMEMVKLLGVADDIMSSGFASAKMRAYKPGLSEQAEILKTWDFVDELPPAPSYPYRTVRMIEQNVHEAIIRDHLKQFRCEVELGKELIDFEQTDQVVIARVRCHAHQGGIEHEEMIRASYLIGADGAKGIVRKLLKLSFLGETRDAEAMIVADVDIKKLDTDYWHVWAELKDGNPARALARPFHPHSTENTMFNIIITGKYSAEEMQNIATDPDALQAAFQGITGRTDLSFDAVPWVSYFRPNMRMVNKFGEGRVFVVGDAAHVHSPAGGQGLNSGVQDSLNLAWKLSLVLKKLSPPSLLDTFTEERLPVIAEMLRRTTGLHISATSEALDFTDEALRIESKSGADIPPWRRGGALFMLTINFRWSTIVLEERKKNEMTINEMKTHAYGGYEDGICGGDRAPEAPGLLVARWSDHVSDKVNDGETSFFNLLDYTRHSVFIFASSFSSQSDAIIDILHAIVQLPTAAAKHTIQTFVVLRSASSAGALEASDAGVDAVLVDRDGNAHDAYLVKDGELTIVIIRPDGYVGAITKAKEDVVKYFEKIFMG